MRKKLKIPLILISFGIIIICSISAFATNLKDGQIVNSNKVWSINLNKVANKELLSQNFITVVDEENKLVNVNLELSEDLKSIIVKPPLKGYNLGKSYRLRIESGIYDSCEEGTELPKEVKFTINNNIPVENIKDSKTIFKDNCNDLTKAGWVKSNDYSDNVFISDYTGNKKYNIEIPYNEYLFYTTDSNVSAKISKELEIGEGPFNIEFDAVFNHLQTPTKNEGWRGFVIDCIANSKRYRFSFNSKKTDKKMDVYFLKKGLKGEEFDKVEVQLPDDNVDIDNVHRWSLRHDGEKNISIYLDGKKIANFVDTKLKSSIDKDKIIIYSDMNDVSYSSNIVYLQSFSVAKTVAIRECEVNADIKTKNLSAKINMAIFDKVNIEDKNYKIKTSVYKNDAIIAKNIVKVDSVNLSMELKNISQRGNLKVVFELFKDNIKIDEVIKNVEMNSEVNMMNLGDKIDSIPNKVYVYDQMDKMLAYDDREAINWGWNVAEYIDREDNINGRIIENSAYAATIKMPVTLNGWFRVYIGYVTGTGSFEVGETKKQTIYKISSDISLKSDEQYGEQWINEKSVFISEFKDNTVLIRPIAFKKARIAYIKLVGLTPEQVELYKKVNEGDKTNRVIYDFDGYSDFFSGKYPTVKDLRSRTVDTLSKKNVAEVNWCLGTTGLIMYNSKFAGNAYEDAKMYEDQMRDGDKLARTQILNIIDNGKSPIEVVAQAGKENNMKVNASLRMDVFYNPLIYGFLNGKMYNKYTVYTQKGSFLLSYYYPEVREYIKNILVEAATFENVSGVTLDFCRYPTIMGLEATQEEKVKIMNDFMRSVRAEMPKGKTIYVRIPYDEARSYGFDPETWIKEGLIDVLIPSNIGKDDFFEIKPYINMVKGSKVKLYVGISADVKGHDITKEEEELVKQGLYIHHKESLGIEQFLLRANDVYQDGADGIFIFNSTAKLYLDSAAPMESRYLGDKVQIEKWHEFEYISGLVVNKVFIYEPTLLPKDNKVQN